MAKANHCEVAVTGLPLADGVVFGKAHARQERNYGADDGGKRPGLRLPGTRDPPHARGMGQVDATGHHGKMRQEGAARATRERTAVGRRQRPFMECLHGGLSLSIIPSCGACTEAALLTREESAADFAQ